VGTFQNVLFSPASTSRWLKVIYQNGEVKGHNVTSGQTTKIGHEDEATRRTRRRPRGRGDRGGGRKDEEEAARTRRTRRRPRGRGGGREEGDPSASVTLIKMEAVHQINPAHTRTTDV